MTTLFAYKMVRDFGFAPNPFSGSCTLATCKPKIRAKAQRGDLILACGSEANRRSGRVICAMRVAGAMTFQEYWDNPLFQKKKASLSLSRSRAFGDNIYHFSQDGCWVQEDSHHSLVGGQPNDLNMRQDTSVDRILWAQEFSYWGREAIEVPSDLGGLDMTSIRDFRKNFDADFVDRAVRWFDSQPRGLLGRPIDWN